MGADDQVMAYSTVFFYIVGGSSVFLAVMTIFGGILRASGNTKSPMQVSIIVNILNVGLDYILIFGIGPIPALGVAGTAIGTTVARMLGCLLLYKQIKKSPVSFELKSIFVKSDYAPLMRLSIPAALERLVMRMGQVVYFGLIVAIGAKTFAAHSIAGNIESFVYMPAYGLATAAATLVGNSTGAVDFKEAKRVAFLSATFGVIAMSFLGDDPVCRLPLFCQSVHLGHYGNRSNRDSTENRCVQPAWPCNQPHHDRLPARNGRYQIATVQHRLWDVVFAHNRGDRFRKSIGLGNCRRLDFDRNRSLHTLALFGLSIQEKYIRSKHGIP